MPGEAGKPAEVCLSLLGLDADHRNLQPAGAPNSQAKISPTISSLFFQRAFALSWSSA
jgi:hypothetical protein